MVTHPSTTQARRCLTLEIRRDPVISPWYGRRHEWSLSQAVISFTFNYKKKLKVYSTRTSQVVTHPSTTQARRCLTLEIRRDPVISPWYGRRQELILNEAIIYFSFREKKKKRVYNTRTSQVVIHPSTIQAQRCLTLEIRRVPVISPWYGRRHEQSLSESVILFTFKYNKRR